MQSVNHRKLISNAFNKLHEQLSVVRAHVETLEDPAAQETVGVHGIRSARAHAQAAGAPGHSLRLAGTANRR